MKYVEYGVYIYIYMYMMKYTATQFMRIHTDNPLL